MNEPENRFQGAPAYRPGPTPPAAALASAPTYNPELHMPPPPPMPTVAISPQGVLYLHQSIRTALSLRDGQPINLVPPGFDSVYWHLDLRPTAARRISRTKERRARAEGIRLPPGLLAHTLTLHLLPGAPAYPHYYPMVPLDALASQTS